MVANFYLFLDQNGLKTGKSLLPQQIISNSVELYPEDKSFHQFLWWCFNTDQEPIQYEFNFLVFGVNSSPFLAQFVFQYHTNHYKKSFSRAADIILQSTYMDDSMDSVLTDEEGINLYKQLLELWEKAGMYP